MQPGDTIKPGTQAPPPNDPQETKEVEVSLRASGQAPEQSLPTVDSTPVELPQPEEQPLAAPTEDSPAPEVPLINEQPSYEVTPNFDDAPEQPPVATVSWTASEYVSHEKGASWFVLVALALAVAAVLVYLLTKDLVAVVVIAIAGVTFGVFSARPPRVLNYAIDQKGVQIGQRLYPFHEFKSFTVNDEGPLPSVLLMPLKRFLPPITVFFEPQTGDDIVAVLSDYLPFEQKKPDAVDKFMSRIRF